MGLSQKSLLFFLFISAFGHFSSAFEGPKVILDAYNGEKLEVSILSYEQADQFFQYVKKQKNIPFGLVSDGCHARAQQMADLAAYKKIDVAKIIVEAGKGTKLTMKSEDGPWQAQWAYHMAPVVEVLSGDFHQTFVIDPSLFDQPVSLVTWLSKVFKDSTDEAEQKAQAYFVSRFTFTPDLKDQVYDELPLKLDRNITGMLSIFSANLKHMGAYYEKCYLVDPETNAVTIGGLPKESVAHHETYDSCQPAGL